MTALRDALGLGATCDSCGDGEGEHGSNDATTDRSDESEEVVEGVSLYSVDAAYAPVEEERTGLALDLGADESSPPSTVLPLDEATPAEVSAYPVEGSAPADVESVYPVEFAVPTSEPITDLADASLKAETLAISEVSEAGVRTEALGVNELERMQASLDDVHPALRARIERVIERMRDEFGHEVTVVEAYRSAERQAHLYEQGRTRPGEIATWTQRSWHQDGLAADLMVDGSFDNKLAYSRLQMIARQEGLRTLGSMDMGHVELPATREADGTVTLETQGPTQRFVGVATPAATAPVAAVAAVATPGQWVTVPGTEPLDPALPARPVPIDPPVIGLADDLAPNPDSSRTAAARVDAYTDRAEIRPTLSASGGDPDSDTLEDGPSDEGASARARATAAYGAQESTEAGELAAFTTQSGVRAEGGTQSVQSVDPMTTLDRANKVQELQDLARTAQPSRVSVRFGEGGGDQLRVGLLNQMIDAQIDLADPESAANVRNRVAELHRAIEAQGMELGALSVNGASGNTGANAWLGGQGDAASELLRTLFGGSAGDSNQGGSERERSRPEQQSQEGRAGSDRPRQESNQEGDT